MPRGYVFDLDGTVYLDTKLIDGAAEVIQYLKDRGDRVVFLTNKSISTRIDYVNKLSLLGIETTLNEVVNSNYITAKYLMDHMNEKDKVLVIGEQPLVDELIEENIRITTNYKDATYVVIGWDREFNYEKINNAYQAWVRGAKLIATNPDRTCPINNGQIPDCGAMIGALEGATGEPIEIVTGKPSPLLAKYVMEHILRLPPSQCYMVGDRLETDIRMGIENEMNAVLVLTGITTKEMVEKAAYKPTYIIDSIRDIIAI